MSIDCNPRIIMQDLILYLDAANDKSLPITAGSNWYDISGNGNHFQMFGTVNKQAGYFSLEQSTTNYFSSRSTVDFPESNVSVEMWSRPAITENTCSLWSFMSENGTSLYQSVYNQKNITLSGPTSVNILTNTNINDGLWKHVVRTSSRTSIEAGVAGRESLYINGELAYSAIALPNINYNTSGILLLGQKPNITGELNIDFSLIGDISIFKVYNRLLSIDEIKKNFNAIRGRYNL
jgi:hypothetical protein